MLAVRVKICGITSLEDARMAAELGADALGFIFVPNTPRYVGERPDLFHLLSSIPPFITRVGVCRNLSDVARLRGLPLDAIQLYERPRPKEEKLLDVVLQGRSLLFALRVRDESRLPTEEWLRGLPIAGLVLDAFHEERLGGGGVRFDWSLAVKAKQKYAFPIILAGGLTPTNVAQAVQEVQPRGVDVSSGVESLLGKKDPAKLEAFVRAAKMAAANG